MICFDAAALVRSGLTTLTDPTFLQPHCYFAILAQIWLAVFAHAL